MRTLAADALASVASDIHNANDDGGVARLFHERASENVQMWKPDLQLNSEQFAVLLFKSRTESRHNQKLYLEGLGGNGSARELDMSLSLARHDELARAESDRLTECWNETHFPETRCVSQGICQVVNFFLHSFIAGEFGPDDSIYGRSDAFLKQPNVVARGTEIFMERLRTNRQGEVLNHDEAEQHATDYLRDHLS